LHARSADGLGRWHRHHLFFGLPSISNQSNSKSKRDYSMHAEEIERNKDKKPLPVKKKSYSLLRVETSLPTALTVSVDGTDVIRCGKFFKPRKNLWITCMQHRHRAFQISGTRNPKAITRCMLQRSSVILALLYYKKIYCGPWIENDFKFWTGMEGFALQQHRASCCLFEQKPLCGPYWWNFGRT